MGLLGNIWQGFERGLGINKDPLQRPKDVQHQLAASPGVSQPLMKYQNRLDQALQGNFKKGGNVKKTGIYRLHKGEKVIPAKKVKKEMAKKMPKHISDIYDRMESSHKKKMRDINTSNRPEWEKEHMRRANSSGIARFLNAD